MNVHIAQHFHAQHITTPLGQMIAIADDRALLLLAFTDRKGLENEIALLSQKSIVPIQWTKSKIIEMIEKELDAYFLGMLKEFKTPLYFGGTPFSQAVWSELQKIPYNQTRSYGQLAAAINKPKAYRAVGRANGCNHMAIIVPCHRVINATGSLGGYNGGIERKRWLIEHEKKRA